MVTIPPDARTAALFPEQEYAAEGRWGCGPWHLVAADIDPLLRETIDLLNTSGWTWTLTGCSWHREETTARPIPDPYIVVALRTENVGRFCALVLACQQESAAGLDTAFETSVYRDRLPESWTALSVAPRVRSVEERDTALTLLSHVVGRTHVSAL